MSFEHDTVILSNSDIILFPPAAVIRKDTRYVPSSATDSVNYWHGKEMSGVSGHPG